ncbi:MAG: hypothetical protein ABI690_12795 [Chloroflexota bacterium]
MVALSIREQLINKLDELSERELEAVLHYAEIMQTMRLPDDYDENRDPSVGFFSAEPDFAQSTEEILAKGFGRSHHEDGSS